MITIVNPLYDNAFKYLMDDPEMARQVLSIFLKRNIISLEPQPQETVGQQGSLHIMRYDYKARIRDDSGREYTVLTEVQKFSNPGLIGRLRRYLGQTYAQPSYTLAEEPHYLPIITIYLVGFDLPEYGPARAVYYPRRPYNLITEEALSLPTPTPPDHHFADNLLHEIYVLFAAGVKPTSNTHTPIEQLLDLFIQKLSGEAKNEIAAIENVESRETIQPIVEHLHRATLNENIIRALELEEELRTDITIYQRRIRTAQEQSEQLIQAARQREAEALREKEFARQREAEAQREKEAARQREAEALKEKAEAQNREALAQLHYAEAQKEKEETIRKLAKSLKRYGVPFDDIQNETGLSKDEIEDL